MSATKDFVRSVAVSVTTYFVVTGVIYGGRKAKEKYDERKQRKTATKTNQERDDNYTQERTR